MTRPRRIVLPLSVILLSLAALGCGIVARNEIALAALMRASVPDKNGVPNPDALGATLAGADACSSPCSARYELAIARGYAALADGDTQMRMAKAGLIHARRAIAARPAWGEAEVLRAYLADTAGDAGEARRALADSYVQPYLRRSALWRIGYAARDWAALDPAVREAVLREAVWYGTIEHADRRAVEKILGDSAAAARFQRLMPADPEP
ncbi:hypothetical protein [Sphingomonas immobilis]|uniref:Sel1 repeat family protein n=1 Tax=Sphingomonas immobilis TaxID=3063997 RepID=A0ABT9A5H1_9SPHN|nr:hypothetical protein [Sphingomonas sp. CA1-15]MDO7844594.1 hypothetical protein [Sphingomonas sp. CA1-15]